MKILTNVTLLLCVVLASQGAYASDAQGERPCARRLPVLSTLESLSANGPYGFATRDFVFVDETRPTPPNGSFPGAPVRTLPTRVFYPVCSPRLEASPPPAQRVPVASGGPFPLLAYAHGLSSTGANARHFAEHLASHGYIIAVPLFPLSNWRAPGGSTVADLAHQPGDLAFVMQQVARLGGADADLAAAVDTQRRGILGLSGGGLTVLIGAYHPLLKIDGIQAAVAHAPLSCFIGPGLYGRSLPVLIITGSADELVPISGPERVFTQAPPPVVLVNLLGGTHTGFMNLEIPFVNNTDTQECERLLSLDPTAGEDQLAEDLTRGVGPDVFNAAGCSPPLCTQRFIQTMGATRQLRLSRAATLAHFEAKLRGRRDAEVFLAVFLGLTNPDVQVRVKH